MIKLTDLIKEGTENNSKIIQIAKSTNKAEIEKIKKILKNAEWTDKEISSAVKKRKAITKKEEETAEAKRMETADALPRKMKDWSYDEATNKKFEKARKDWKKKYGTTKWTKSSYNKWIKDVSSNGGKNHSYDMAQNAKEESGLLAFVQKQIKSEYGDEKPLERIQWDIEAS